MMLLEKLGVFICVLLLDLLRYNDHVTSGKSFAQ